MRYYGEYGGRALRAFKADVPFVVGAIITPEVAMKWPLPNRKALENQHKVEWFGPPVDEAPQKAAPKGTKKVEEPVEESEETNENALGEADAEESEEAEVLAEPKAAKKKGSRRKK